MSLAAPQRKKQNIIYYVSAALLVLGSVLQLTNVGFWYLLVYPALIIGTLALVYEVSVLRRRDAGHV